MGSSLSQSPQSREVGFKGKGYTVVVGAPGHPDGGRVSDNQ
jgi:hypothetical protein